MNKSQFVQLRDALKDGMTPEEAIELFKLDIEWIVDQLSNDDLLDYLDDLEDYVPDLSEQEEV